MNHKLLLSAIAALTIASGAFAQTQVQRAVQRGTVQQRGTVKKGTVVKQGTITEQQKEAIKKAGQDRRPVVSVIGQTATNQTSSDQSAAEKDKARRKAINDYLLNEMFNLENPRNLVRDIKGASLPQTVVEGGVLYELKEIPHDVDAKEGDIFTEDDNDLFPGRLLVADKNLANGNPIKVAGLGTGKVDVSLDIDTGGDKFVIEDVPITFGEIQKAIQTLVRQMYSSNGYKQPARLKSITGDYSSKEEIAIKAGCDLNFAAKFSGSVSTNQSHTTITHIDDLSQVYYNVVVTPADNDYSNLFGPDITVDDIKNAVKNRYHGCPFVFISQMSYGRRLYKFSDFNSSDFKLDASVSASYSGASFTSTSNITKNSTVSNMTVYLRGGDPSLGSGLIQDKASVASVLAKYEKNGSNTALSMSQANQGISMAYKTTYLGSQQTCQRSTTGKYSTAEYRKCLNSIYFKVHAKVDHKGNPGSARVKPKFYYQTLKVDPNTGKILQRHITHDPIEPTIKCYDSWTYTLKLDPNEYIDGNIECSVRTKYTDWKQSIGDNYIDPIRYNGQLNTLMFAGTVGGYVYVSESSDIEFIGIKKGKK
jgi:hypothetical protein